MRDRVAGVEGDVEAVTVEGATDADVLVLAVPAKAVEAFDTVGREAMAGPDYHDAATTTVRLAPRPPGSAGRSGRPTGTRRPRR